MPNLNPAGGTRLKRLFADIETSPNVVLAFSAGYNLTINHDSIVKERKIICIGYKWEGERDVHVLRWSKDQDDRQMLIEFFQIAERADEIVAHFGAGFDIPWLRTRCLYHKLSPVPLWKMVDTKALASKYFYFNSNKLDYISSFLGHGKKLKTEFALWRDILLNNCQKSLNYMCKYCGIDVKRLESVFKDMQPYVHAKSHAGVIEGKGRHTCPHCASDHVHHNKRVVSESGTVKHRMKCVDCGAYYCISDSVYKQLTEPKMKKKGKKGCK